jgi:hypothetical protein
MESPVTARELRLRAKKVNMIGLFTFGIGGWFKIGRKGTGIIAIILHFFGLLFFLFGGLGLNLVVWVVGMIVPGMWVRRDAMDQVLFDREVERQQMRDQLAGGGNA